MYTCSCFLAGFDQGIQVSYSKENETVTLAFPEELKVTFKFCRYSNNSRCTVYLLT